LFVRRAPTIRGANRRISPGDRLGYRPFFVYSSLAAANAQADKMDEAKAALAEARRLNPKLTVKWYVAHGLNSALIDGVRKAGCRRNERDPPRLAVNVCILCTVHAE
jgi:hypothetical protein